MNKFTLKKQILPYIFILISLNLFSQINYVKMENVEYLNSSISNCGTINLNSSQNHQISFDIKIEVVSYTNGPVLTYGNVVIAYWSGSAEVIYETIPVNENNWTYNPSNSTATFEIPRNITLNSNSFDDSNGGSVYIRYEESINNFFLESCTYDVTKPYFSISTNNVSIPCGSTATQTFYVYNENNSPGVLEYEWDLGSGWEHEGSPVSTITTTTNRISLTPYSYPPSDIEVTPILDYANYPELVVNIELSDYTPNYSISGNNFVCNSTETYTINNLPSGTTVQSWSTSNSNIATVSTLNATQAELTAVGTGNVTLTATVMNACGQTANIDLPNVFVGNPTVTNTSINGGHSNVSIYSSSQLSVAWSPGATGYYWFITTISSSCPSGGVPPKFQTGSGSASTITTSYPLVNVLWGTCTGNYVINCRAINDCGSSDYTYKNVTVFDPDGNNPCDDFGLKLKSNPIKEGNVGIIMYRPAPGLPCDDLNRIAEKRKTTSYQVKLQDFKGRMVHEKNYKTENITLENLKLKSGLYFLNIISSDGITKQRTLVVK